MPNMIRSGRRRGGMVATTPPGPQDVSGTALAALTFASQATGTRDTPGTALAALTFASQATGTRTVSGTAATALTFAAAATGTVSGLWSDDFTNTTNLTVPLGSVTAVSGKLRANTADTDCVAYKTGISNVANHYTEVVVSTLSHSVSFAGAGVRYNAGDYYACTLDGNGNAEIYSYVGGFGLLASSAVTIGTLPGTLRAEANGTTIRLLWRGVQVHSITDTAISTGKPHVYLYANVLSSLELDSVTAGAL